MYGRVEAVQPDLGAVSTHAFSSLHMPSGDAGMTGRVVKPEPVSSYVVPQSTSNDHKVNDLFCGNRVSQFVMHSRDGDPDLPTLTILAYNVWDLLILRPSPLVSLLYDIC